MQPKPPQTGMRAPRTQVHRGWPVAALAFVAAVLVISFLPPKEKNELHTRGRWHGMAHLVVFGTITVLLVRAGRSGVGKVWAVLGSLGLGCAVEIGEHLVYGTRVEWRDIAVDTLAVLLGTCVALMTGAGDEAEGS